MGATIIEFPVHAARPPCDYYQTACRVLDAVDERRPQYEAAAAVFAALVARIHRNCASLKSVAALIRNHIPKLPAHLLDGGLDLPADKVALVVTTFHLARRVEAGVIGDEEVVAELDWIDLNDV